MSTPACSAPLSMDALLAYWSGELSAASEAELETHLFDCPSCRTRLEELIALRDGVRALTRRGALRAIVTEEFIQRLRRAGVRLREYSVPAFGSVNCSVGPDDEVMIARLEADMRDVDRVDALLYDLEGGGHERLEDVPLGAARDAVIITPRIELLRALPASTARMRLVAVDARGERLLGDYCFHHSPAPQQSAE